MSTPEIILLPANMSDAGLLLLYRNDPETIRQSVQQKPIESAEHLAWLEAVLDTPRCQLYVANEIQASVFFPVGTGRLDLRDNGSVELSLTVAPGHRGRGVGGQLLAALIKKAREFGFHRLRARVRANNVASMIAFLKAGFVPVTDQIVEMELECPIKS